MSHPTPQPRPPASPSRWSRSRIWLWLILGSACTAVIAHHFLYSSVEILGASMEPSLHEGERRIVNRWRFRLTGLQRGALVVFREPNTDYAVVKRVIALPGDTLRLCPDGVYVNDRLIPEPYVAPNGYTHSRRMGDRLIRLGPQECFVMGDNRLISQDSRWYGPVPLDRVIGILAQF